MANQTVQPVQIASDVQTPTFTNLNYTNQDYYSLKQRLVNLLKQQFADNFNDLFESSLAIMLIEIVAFAADILSFKTDQVANEVYIDTVSQVDNAFRLARLVGFKPTPPIPAQASFSLTITSALSNDVIIPAGTQIPIAIQGQPSMFELFAMDVQGNPKLNDPILIPAGNLTNTAVIGLQGQTFTNVFTADGTANFVATINRSPVIFDSVNVTVDGVSWTQVDFFTDSQQRREYRVEFDSSYNAFVMFGDNRAGLVPSSGSRIEVDFRIGGGVNGNIITGFINTQLNFNVQGQPYSTPVHITNYTAGKFGYAGDGIADVQRKLPAYLRMQNRVVAGSDYKTFAEQFATPYLGQIGKAAAVLRNQGCSGNIVDIYLLALDAPIGLQNASDDLKFAFREALEPQKMMTDFICIHDGIIIDTDVTVDATVDKFYTKLLAELNAGTVNAVNQFFALSAWDFGQGLRAADLVAAVRLAVPQIQQADVTFTTDDSDNSGDAVSAAFNQIIRPGTIQVTINFS